MCVYLPHFFGFVNPLFAVSFIGENESFIKNPSFYREIEEILSKSPLCSASVNLISFKFCLNS